MLVRGGFLTGFTLEIDFPGDIFNDKIPQPNWEQLNSHVHNFNNKEIVLRFGDKLQRI